MSIKYKITVKSECSSSVIFGLFEPAIPDVVSMVKGEEILIPCVRRANYSDSRELFPVGIHDVIVDDHHNVIGYAGISFASGGPTPSFFSPDDLIMVVKGDLETSATEVDDKPEEVEKDKSTTTKSSVQRNQLYPTLSVGVTVVVDLDDQSVSLNPDHHFKHDETYVGYYGIIKAIADKHCSKYMEFVNTSISDWDMHDSRHNRDKLSVRSMSLESYNTSPFIEGSELVNDMPDDPNLRLLYFFLKGKGYNKYVHYPHGDVWGPQEYYYAKEEDI